MDMFRPAASCADRLPAKAVPLSVFPLVHLERLSLVLIKVRYPGGAVCCSEVHRTVSLCWGHIHFQ